MAAIRSLLNPAPVEEDSGKQKRRGSYKQLPTPTTPTFPRYMTPVTPSRKKQKLCKDAAVFTRGPIQGECNYPPHEYQDELLEYYHKQFEVYPMGEIADYPRHIPYNSEKKSFLEKTGRESLEVFQYQFRVPGDDTMYTMLWDYNIGLVRTTPLFKCTGYSKTTPAKMLNRNAGLREICHSITGGALVAQGYWMPYEAAKAVATTFCWSIRYALTPVFGVDFPDLCIPPDSDKFGDMLIDPEITNQCTQKALDYRNLELEDRGTYASSPTPSPLTPDTPTYPRQLKQFRRGAKDIDSSGYSSEASCSDNYSLSPSPHPSYRNNWTAANTPRSIPVLNTIPPATKFDFPGFGPKRSKKRIVDSSSSSESSSPAVSPKSQPRDFYKNKAQIGVHERNNGYDTSGSHASSKLSVLPSDEKAAWLLMGLRLQMDSPGSARLGRKRRASALV